MDLKLPRDRTDRKLVTRRRSKGGRPVVLDLEAIDAEGDRGLGGCSHSGYGPEMIDVEMEAREPLLTIRRIKSKADFFSSDPAEEWGS